MNTAADRETAPAPLMARDEVIAAIGLSVPTLYRYMAAGHFPRPIKLGLHFVRWHRSEVELWLADRPRYTYQPRAT